MAMASPSLVGTRPQRTRDVSRSRDSNVLRASVLDVALELGIGTSRALENLIFDSILEEDEVSFLAALLAFYFLASSTGFRALHLNGSPSNELLFPRFTRSSRRIFPSGIILPFQRSPHYELPIPSSIAHLAL